LKDQINIAALRSPKKKRDLKNYDDVNNDDDYNRTNSQKGNEERVVYGLFKR
jgi:hypothetical protein